MSTVAAVSGATADELDALTEKVKEMGAKTKFSATESAEAMNYMAMAGWKTEDMLNGIEGIMNLAAASGENLATTSDIVTDALTAFGLSAADSTHFVDILAAASSNANTNVSMMGETFKYVAPVAGALGFSAEDCATAIGLMANSGIKASQAGTSLRSIMSRLTSPTDEVQAALAALDLTITNSDGSMKSLNEIMLDLREGFSDLSEAQQAQMASAIGGQEAMSGLLAIVNASDSDFSKLQDSIYGCDGAAAQMAGTMQDNLQGKITLLKSALEGLGIAIYEDLEEPLKSVTDIGQQYIEQLTEAFEEGGPEGLAGALGNILADLVARATEFAPQMVELAVQLISALVEGILDNLPQLAEAAGEIADVILEGIGDLCPALEPVTDAIQAIIDNFDKLIPVVESAIIVFAGLKAGMVVQSAVQTFQQAQVTLSLFAMQSNGASLAQAALNGALTVGETIVALLTGKMSLAELATAGWSKAQAALNAVLSANPIALVALAIAAVIAIIVVLWNKCDWFREGVLAIWEAIKEGAINAWNAITEFFTDTIPQFIDNVIAWFAELPDRLAEWGVSVKETITSAVSEMIDNVITFFSELPENIMYWLGFTLTSIILWGADLINWAITNIPIFVENIVTFISELPGKIQEWLLEVIRRVGTWAGSMVAKAVETGNNFVESVISFIKNLPSMISTWLGNVIAKVLNFASDMRTKATEAGKGFFENIVSALTDLPSKMGEIGANIVSGIWQGISNGWGWLVDQVKNLANSLFQGAKDALDIHSPSKKFKWLGEMCVAGLDEPIADYNPYDTLDRTLKAGAKGVTASLVVAGAGQNANIQQFDYSRMGVEMQNAINGMVVSMDSKPVGRLVAQTVNEEIGRINGRRT